MVPRIGRGDMRKKTETEYIEGNVVIKHNPRAYSQLATTVAKELIP